MYRNAFNPYGPARFCTDSLLVFKQWSTSRLMNSENLRTFKKLCQYSHLGWGTKRRKIHLCTYQEEEMTPNMQLNHHKRA